MNLNEFIRLCLEEDIGAGDFSSLSCIDEHASGTAQLFIKDDGIIAGAELASEIFAYADPETKFMLFKKDGEKAVNGEIGFSVEGKVHSILQCERLVLNSMQRMSGIATLTAQFVEQLRGTKAKMMDTRKTTPLFRYFEKWAVRIGGGYNHRMGLYDMIMLKDNHVDYAGGITQAVDRCVQYLRQKNLNLKIEVETRSLDEVSEAIATQKIDRIMLDNFSINDLRKAVKMINGICESEASGNINLDNVRDYGLTGVDYISAGCLTHSYKNFDLSLKAV